ncbi:tetratricopeptide (TPR) repeat protein [Streptacidiphilus sp. MAP12-33]|uniref:MFS transporter n=1 Tax=Streptacidiphilus sp. MAP12-33 TaxID=3156266 RepID=UPI003518355B
MVTSGRGPNEKLGSLLALAGISNAGLARRVNDLGAQRGLTFRYDKTSVARWVTKGMVPQGPVPHLIATAIGGKLGRGVPLEEIGLGSADPTPEVGLSFPRDVPAAVRSATELWRLDPGRARKPGLAGPGWWDSLAGTFSVAAYATPVSRWLITPVDGSVARDAAAATSVGGASFTDVHEPAEQARLADANGRPYRVGHADAAKLRQAAEEARRWDSRYGGGDWRSSMVPECLRRDAAPLLLASYSDEVGRALFGATAELSRLAGWMAFDTGQHEAAQRYYIQALRLARAAADVPLGGYVLASMSLQATYRGAAEEGVDLAQAAVERNRGLATARTMSFFRLVESRAHARAGDAAACAAALAAAESWLERARTGDADPAWIDFHTWDRLAADAAEAFRDLGMPGKVREFTERALARPTEEYVRSHGLRLIVSAMAELDQGELERAVAAGNRALDVAGRISSQRTREYLGEMLKRLDRYRGERIAEELVERARLTLAAPA